MSYQEYHVMYYHIRKLMPSRGCNLQRHGSRRTAQLLVASSTYHPNSEQVLMVGPCVCYTKGSLVYERDFFSIPTRI